LTERNELERRRLQTFSRQAFLRDPERAFAFFRGACARGIYDNMKTAVDTIFVGKERQYNRRFLQMCAHHLVDPVACTPASGWEKGQVENQVGLVRERFFTPRLRFKTYDPKSVLPNQGGCAAETSEEKFEGRSVAPQNHESSVT
jgi:hypothetical protein